MSALDDLLADHDNIGDSPRLHEQARAELAALRRRCEELELLFKKAVTGSLHRTEVGGWYFASEWPTRNPDWKYLHMDDDGTGIPILTDEARSALKAKP